MQIDMLSDVVLSDRQLRVGLVDVPDALATALIAQGLARVMAPPIVAAMVQPRVKKDKRPYVAATS